MNDFRTLDVRAEVVDWDRTMDGPAIAARLDALHLRDARHRRLVVNTLDVLAEELVGRGAADDANLKARIQTMRRAALSGGGRPATGALDPGETSGPSGTVGQRQPPDREGQP
ncbi:hypothetical protein [Nakamurella sp.]|uniref:hypothetical protein n=1 Tax=Nakamurella sp. TaxID=1869182 RepID=UPI0037830F80